MELHYLLLVLACLGVTCSADKTCFNCGYKCTGMADGYCSPQPIDTQGKIPFCGDSAAMSDKTKVCGGADECCGAIREYFVMTDDSAGTTKTDMITFHGCEKDLAGALGAEFGVICDGHTNACYNVSRDDIQQEFLTTATACFCDGDRCNNAIPDLPMPAPSPTQNPPKTCYNCGYMCTDIKPNEDCIPKAHPGGSGIPFCSDHASMGSMTRECGGADECCGSLVEYLEIKNGQTGKVTIDKLAFHGCEKDLAGALNEQFDVICNEHANSCYNISREDIQTEFATSAEACFCDGDRCNGDIPNLPDNLTTDNPPTDGSTDSPPASKTCYNCGYKCTDMQGSTCTPKPLDEEGKIPFCGTNVDFESNTKECTGADDCCGALREYFVMTDNSTGTTKTDMITFHGCEKDLAEALGAKFGVICDGHTDACYNVSRDDFQDEFLTTATACFCEGDRCNKDLPDLPFPDPPTPTPTEHPPKTCYNCGYACTNIKPNEDCIPHAVPGSPMAFCSDHASMESMTKKCGGADECCGSLVEYIQVLNHETNETTQDKIAFHGCEKDLAEALGGQIAVVCNGHTNNCYNVSREDINDDFITSAEACFCDGDRCNDNIPNLPDNLPGPTDAPGQAAILTASLISLLICLLVLN